MSAYQHRSLLSGPTQVENCGPASSCWEAMVQNSSVNAAATEAAAAILYDRSPLGLSLFAAGDTISLAVADATSQSSSCLLDGLLREINHRRKMFSERTIPWIKWQIPHHLLDSTDVTQLMYCIGRQFRLSDSHGSFYCVNFRLPEVTPERLALFRGLGFNAIEIDISPDALCQTEALAYCAALAEDFHYTHLGIEWQATSAELYPTLLENLGVGGTGAGRPPASISFRPADAECPAASALLQSLYWSLTGTGYEVLGNDVFVQRGSPLALAQRYGLLSRNLEGYNCQQVKDILGLGPGNTSALGPVRCTNAAGLSQYLVDSFDRYRQEAVAPAIREVIDQLLCYHQLNLIYFREQHQLDLEYLFSQLEVSQTDTRELPSRGGPHRLPANTRLYGIKNHTLTLTASGILQLSSLCQGLSQLQLC